MKLETPEILLSPTISGKVKMSVNRTTKIKGIGRIFGDQLIFSTNTQHIQSVSLRWKQLDPFEIDNDEGDNFFGFSVNSEDESIDFFVRSPSVLDRWLRVLERVMILTDVKDEFKFGAVLGRGSYGCVYKAWNMARSEAVAIKVIKKEFVLSQPHHLRLLKQEIEALRKVDHKYMIRIQGVYEDETRVYITTDLLSGGDLLDVVTQTGRVSEDEASKYIRSLLMALEHLHSQNFVHRDVKLENILISSNSAGEPRIVLTDLGLCVPCYEEDGCLREP
jgi:serine/threonine protein kinase